MTISSLAELVTLFKQIALDPSGRIDVEMPADQVLRIPAWGFAAPGTIVLHGRTVAEALGAGHRRLHVQVVDVAQLTAEDCDHVTVVGSGSVDVADTPVEASARARVVARNSRVTARDDAVVETADPPVDPTGRAKAHSHVAALGRVQVTVRGRARAEMGDAATVDAFDDSIVAPNAVCGVNGGRVRLHDRARLEWMGGSPYDNAFEINAGDDSVVDLTVGDNGARLLLRDRAKAIVRFGKVHVELAGAASADVGSGCTVIARDQAHVTARGSAKVTLQGEATCTEIGDEVTVRDARRTPAGT